MLAHDVIKIQFVKAGYLPNYPYHLISDEEMCDAFIKYDGDIESYVESDTVDYFRDKYPLLDSSLLDKYRELVEAIQYHVNQFKNSLDADRKLPDWIYSYMLDAVISVDSNIMDIHDMLVAMGIDNLDDEFLPEACISCYEVSKRWLMKIPNLDHRPPTLFGEPHVIKSLRLDTVDLKF